MESRERRRGGKFMAWWDWDPYGSVFLTDWFPPGPDELAAIIAFVAGVATCWSIAKSYLRP
jgi:hypothetical protein